MTLPFSELHLPLFLHGDNAHGSVSGLFVLEVVAVKLVGIDEGREEAARYWIFKGKIFFAVLAYPPMKKYSGVQLKCYTST